MRGYWQSKQSLVEGSGEERIQQVLMDQSQAQDTTTEAEPGHETHTLWKTIINNKTIKIDYSNTFV